MKINILLSLGASANHRRLNLTRTNCEALKVRFVEKKRHDKKYDLTKQLPNNFLS